MVRLGALGACLALLLAGSLSATACSLFHYSCPRTGTDVVSGRTEDFIPGHKVGWRIDVVPPGHQTHGRPPCPTPADCPPAAWESKFSWAALTGLNGSIVVDSMNSQGLAVGLLWLDGSPFDLPYSPSHPGKTALAWLDVVPYIMDHFGTVKDAVEFLLSGDVQVTTSLPPMPYQHVLAALGFGPTQVPLHMSLQDAKGEAALIEFTPEKIKVYWDAVVVANDPPYPEHQAWLKRWRAEVKRTLEHDEGMDLLPGPPSSYARPPGSFESIARSVRLHLMMEAACSQGGPYPDREWSPQPGGISANTAIAMSILRSVEIPWGGTGQSMPGTFSAGDTITSFLREHTTGRYFWRTPGNPRWQGVRLRGDDAGWAAYQGKVRTIDFMANHKHWFGDLTAPGSEAGAGDDGVACLQKQATEAVVADA